MDKAREATTKETIRVLKAAMNVYYVDTGRYPASLSGLLQDDGVQGWKGPYVEKEPQDGWGRPFRYTVLTAENFEIRSAGKDDRADTEDDVTSRNL
jgi:general secretion pathway protein G